MPSPLLAFKAEYAWVFVQVVDDIAEDPLIDQGGESAIYVGTLLLVAMLVIAVGVVSQRTEMGILLALFLSAIFVAIILAL